jgi:uncharacterized pyridoxamine 5'-phosphate oxidase family protein
MNREEVIAYIQQVHFGYLATVGIDNTPRVRPIGIHNIYNNDLYFFTFGNTRKVAEMQNNPQVEVVWSKLEEQSQVRVRGKVFLETCQEVQHQFKEDNPIVGKLLPPQAQLLFQLYRLEPSKVEIAPGLTPYIEVDW